ncbi:inactive rhomboid protein 1 isoform X2 [Contarinia nasturtii]|uniref:inactive rhomboid protein 1 isoform X2 n=1 Tax=Contarinia nasturtii TaxID=265458 RepID=UPI0012D43C45|nr:inactive rhomboid protein 1 isoform X2 [Contarinia nasturtii]
MSSQLSPKKLHHHQPLSIHNGNVNQCHDLQNTSNNHHLGITSTSTQTNNCCDINGVINGGTIKRRKSKDIQITNKSIQSIDGNFSDQPHSNDDDSCSTTSHILPANSSPTTHTLNNQIKSPNSTTLNGYHSYSLANNSNYAQSIDQNASVSNYRRNCNVPVAFFDPPPSGTPNRLSIHHPASDIYDPEITTCCLPPPSPAPNSDRFIGIPPQHHQQHHQTHQQSQLRYKNSIPDRYRDVASKCDRYLPPPHYLASGAPLVSNGGSLNNNVIDSNSVNMYGNVVNRGLVGNTNNSIVTNSTDTYLSGYLSSTVHTPVKRYIPSTNTIATDIYSDSTVVLPHHQQTPRNSSQSNCNTLTSSYRYRMKCCPNLENIENSNAFATTPRARQLNSTKLSMSATASPKSLVPSVSSTSTLSLSSGKSGSSSVRSSVRNVYEQSMNQQNAIINSNHHPQQSQASHSQVESQELVHTNVPFEHHHHHTLNAANSYVSAIIPSNSMNNSAQNTGNGTCLHCNTMRRTTGVHQTTQTGPVSPIPQNINNKTVFLGFSDNGDFDKTSSNSAGLRQVQLQQQQQHHHQQQQQQQQQPQPQTMQQSFNRDGAQQMQIQQQHQHQQQQITAQQSQSQLESQESLVQSQLADESDQVPHSSRKQKIKQYVKREIAKFFGVDVASEERERVKWSERQKRLALRRFGSLKQIQIEERRDRQQSDRPDILPVDHVSASHHYYDRDNVNVINRNSGNNIVRRHNLDDEIDIDDDDELEDDAAIVNQHLIIERKAAVTSLLWLGLQYAIQACTKKVPRNERQWSRSFAPHYLNNSFNGQQQQQQPLPPSQQHHHHHQPQHTAHSSDLSQSNELDFSGNDAFDGVSMPNLQENELFFDSTNTGSPNPNSVNSSLHRGTRISSQLLDGVQDNSRRPTQKKLKLLHVHQLDDRYDHRPYFTYWINTVQVLVLCLTLICYGFGPVGIGMEKKNGQVLVTSLSLQQVQHQEPRNIWIGPRGDDLVHLGAKFSACMRKDLKIMDVMAKTRRQERETACCIRNDDSGCVQSSQADCSVRGLYPTKSISTWKKWSPGESGPGGRISGSVCGLDPKYCDAPASIAPYEWPDDITKWPICRKTNSFSQRFRYKDHTAEHMVCEVIGHPCCISVYGECRITTREFCDFVNGYFHEEASLCSQVSCLNDICGMFPFISPDAPDQFYRLFTSLCLHAGIIHLVITVAFQHIFLTDLERLLGPIRTAILYVGSGVGGNLISAIFLPYKPEVGPLASIAGVVSSMAVLLIMIHWKQLKRPHMALMKLIFLAVCIFAIGTLPWQQHIVGLIGGILCGTVLTITMVPFLSITTKYGRKAKIKLVWTCILLHVAIYATLFILFYLCPMAISTIGLWGSDADESAIGGGYSVGGNIVACDNNKGMQCGGTSNNAPGGIVRSAINI